MPKVKNKPKEVDKLPETLPKDTPKENISFYLPNIPTVIICGSNDCLQKDLDIIQQAPVNIIAINHSIAKFNFQEKRVVWAVYDKPDKFPDCIPEHLSKVRQIIVPSYKSSPWLALDPSPYIQLVDYEYQNVLGANVEPFSFEGTVYGHNNTACLSVAYALRNNTENIYMYDLQFNRDYAIALRTLEIWQAQSKIRNRIFNLNGRKCQLQCNRESLDKLIKSLA